MTQNNIQDETNAGQIQYWNEIAGAKWVANQEKLDRLMAPLTDALVAVAAPARGTRVLEIGPGCGDLSLRLAGRIGVEGHILAVDISEPMLAHAEARRRHLSPGDHAAVEFRHADAMIEAFQPVHDLLVSRFGVMFFDDRPRAFANLHAGLKPGARFALLTWRTRAENEWMQAPLDWIASILPTQPEVPGEIGPFALANVDETRAMMERAGFSDIVATPIDSPLVIGAGASDAEACEDAMIIFADTGPASRQMREAEPEVRTAALALLRAGIASPRP